VLPKGKPVLYLGMITAFGLIYQDMFKLTLYIKPLNLENKLPKDGSPSHGYPGFFPSWDL
jgi:hypothetical protein